MVDLAQTINEWKDVEGNKDDEQYLGDICFSLRYVPTSGKVFKRKDKRVLDICMKLSTLNWPLI